MNKTKILPEAIKLLMSDLKSDLKSLSFKKDLTSNNLIKKNSRMEVAIVAREEITLCGIFFIQRFISKIDPALKVKTTFQDGDKVEKNKAIALISGNSRKILGIERTVLNFIQSLSSVSTSTNKIMSLLEKSKTKLLDTRKTLPGLRLMHKYATFIGGAKNHRMGLFDDILIKDNHIKVGGGIKKILEVLKKKKITNYKIECDTIKQVKDCLEAGTKYILLDNMSPEKIISSIKLKKKKSIIFEVSGGINLKNLNKFSKLNADYISIGYITQNPEPIDIGMDIIKKL